MKPPVMSAMAMAGLFHKKDRILCYRDHDDFMANWLRRQRFRVESLSSESLSAMRKATGSHLFDVIITEATVESNELEQNIHELYALLKPSGRLLLSFQTEDLFGAVFGQEMKKKITALLAPQPVASLQQLPCSENLPSDIIVVKKGGAYKPRQPVQLITDPDIFRRTCDALHHVPVLGLDVETTLTEPRILCTVQMATEQTTYIIDALPLKDLSPLKRLMENESVLKIIHNKKFEENVLGHYGIEIRNIYDTLTESRKRHKKNADGGHTLGEVCERDLGIYLDKSLQASDWTLRPLTQEQRDYAATDAEVLIRLYRVFIPVKPPENMDLF